MNLAQLFFTQMVLNALVYALIALWYVAPRLARLPRSRALAPLLFLHTFRTVGLVFLVPGVVGTRLPDAFAVPAAYGDLLAAVLALGALLMLRARWRAALVLVWLFNLEGMVDLLNAFIQAARVNLAAAYALGPAWLILTFVVPALLVAHVLIFWLLLRPQRPVGANLPIPGAAMTPFSEYAVQPPDVSEARKVGQQP
ncbi:MAG: hypothetical protein PVSMB4_09740 [Ktedonobacterales bacterium]